MDNKTTAKGRIPSALHSIISKIKEYDFSKLSDFELKEISLSLRKLDIENDLNKDGILPKAFALVKEVIKRKLNITPFDVQLYAAISLSEGKLIEMQTGEGKTLCAVFVAYYKGLTSKGVHILTFNDYLAKRDAQWMGQIYTALGLSCGYITQESTQKERKAAYNCDITYVSAKEAGFDFLRDNLVLDNSFKVHRNFNFVIIDEADSILIDEARVPLIIAGSTEGASLDSRFAYLAEHLIPKKHYETDGYERNVYLTEAGIALSEAFLNCGNLYDEKNCDLLTSLNLALHAKVLLKKDTDYIISEGKIELIDEFTGRVAERRQFPDGLQAALEAKENLEQSKKGRILGTITLQHFIKQYLEKCGMTATAMSSFDEFKDTYNFNIEEIPTNVPCIRIDNPDVIFSNKQSKILAIVDEILKENKRGRPILVGTCSVSESEYLYQKLKSEGIDCVVLNAKNDYEEAELISKAGLKFAVTVSTNMAGRGVDIKLGRNPQEHEEITALGGLLVIGTNRHESIRIDNQLRGRAGRQGDPGESVFFISLEDDLIKRFGVDKVIPKKYIPNQDSSSLNSDGITPPLIWGQKKLKYGIAHIQRVIDGQNFDIRKTLNKYSDILEDQRIIFHKYREELLISNDPLKVAKLLTLDEFWADYLEYIASLREGIHLVGFSKKDPLDEYHIQAIKAFDQLQSNLKSELEALYYKDDLDNFVINSQRKLGTSSTWTYAVTDNYFLQVLSDAGRLKNHHGYDELEFLLTWPIKAITKIIEKLKK